ncbi:MAG: hypothetical protein ACI8XV_002640 [Arenicella sp.]|jgi:uncharacterized protein YhhL (DUF1145 family)
MIKIIPIALWAIVIASFLTVFPYHQWLRIFGVVLLVTHLAEYFIYSNRINKKGDSRFKSLLMTIVFGVVYVKSK